MEKARWSSDPITSRKFTFWGDGQNCVKIWGGNAHYKMDDWRLSVHPGIRASTHSLNVRKVVQKVESEVNQDFASSSYAGRHV